MSSQVIQTQMMVAAVASFIGVAGTAAAEPRVENWQAIDRAQYVGAKKCAECHVTHYDGWKDTAHNKMIRAPVTEGANKTVLADFSQPFPARTFGLADIKWVIGSRWKQRYIGEVNGEEVVYPVQWSVQEKKWQNYTAKSDWWWPTHQDWKTRSNFKLCAGCHSTGVDVATQGWAELNIACESCHGPGRAHAEKPALENIINPARLSTARSMDICLSCHQAGKPPSTDYAWPVGFQPGLELAKFWQGLKPEEGKQTAEFWHNGTAHKNRVQGNTFLQSVMRDHGLQCSNCHDSHSARHTSLTLKSAADNALCFTCHGPGKDAAIKQKDLTDHTHHAATSTGSRCIECHMPKIGENAVAGEARNHTFDFISPSETIRTGDPNSCNACHADKTPQWALDAARKWWPKLK